MNQIPEEDDISLLANPEEDIDFLDIDEEEDFE